jgi:hypothetical protein
LKQLIAALAVSLGLLSCSACSKQETLPNPVPLPSASVPAPTPQSFKVSNGKLEVSLPSGAWVELKTTGEFKAFSNTSERNLFMLAVEPTSFTNDQYVLSVVMGIKDSGGVVSSSKQTMINNVKFTLVSSSKNNVKVYMWLAVDSKVGYMFACGGPAGEDQLELCSTIAATIKL